MRKLVALAAAAAAFVASPAAAQAVADGSFEQPALGYGNFAYAPSASGASFNDHSGIAADGSAFGFEPDGSGQVAFLQGSNYSNALTNGIISLDVTGLTIGDPYAFTFLAASRPDYAINPFTVSFDGVNLGTFSASSTDWTAFTTNSFLAGATSGTLTFAGVTPTTGDQDVGLDNVQVAAGTLIGAVPEPATWAMMLLGFGAIGLVTRRKRVPTLLHVA